MLKIAHGLASIVFVAIPCCATSVSAESSCYMITSAGQRISLRAICSKQAPAGSAKISSPRYDFQTPVRVLQARTYGSAVVQEGTGGRVFNGTAEDYHYQVWAKSNSSAYRLVVWREQDFPNGSPIATSAFKSVREALDYFDCRYTDKSIPACPRN